MSDSIWYNNAVQSFFLMRLTADKGAILQMYELAKAQFEANEHVLKTTFEVGADEISGPTLFMNIDTNGMDIDEQLRKEVEVRDVIRADERLREAKKYVVINFF